MAWNFPLTDIVRYDSSGIDLLMRTKANKHVSKHFTGDKKGFYTSAAQRPVMLKANSDTTVWNLIAKGSRETVEAAAAAFHADEKSFTDRVTPYRFHDGRLLPQAEKYALGQQLF